jgi:mRNA interferase MazF
MAYIPDSGDIVWITFNPQAGHEQAGHRPALILSTTSMGEVCNHNNPYTLACSTAAMRLSTPSLP